MTEERAKVPPERYDEPEGVILPDEPEGQVAEGGTATVVLGAAAGTLAGAFLGPVGAIVGAVAGGALASAVTPDAQAGEPVRDEEVRAAAEHEEHAGSLMDGLSKAMGNTMHEMGLDQDGGQAGGVKAVVEASARACALARERLIAQMDQVTTPEERTILQMAINAVNLSVAELETASGSL